MGTRYLIVLANLALTAAGLCYSSSLQAAQSDAAEKLERLELKFDGDEVQAVIEADGMMEHRVYLLDEPHQLVLDILYIRNNVKEQAPKKTHALLEKVRSQELPMTAYIAGEHDKTFARLIFDLRGPAQYWIRGETGELIVGLSPRDENAGTDESTEEDGGAEAETASGAEDPSDDPNVSARPSEYGIEPADVDPEVFFATDPPDSEHYKVGPEDVIEIRVFELEQLNRTVRILADGNVNLPLIGLVPVQGLTSTQVAERVAGKLQNRFVQNPQVSVMITEFNSRKISLLGAVSQPATYPLVGRRNLLQVIADAGGLSADAGGILYIFRPMPDGRSARLTVPLNELLIKGDPKWNIWLLSGDIVSIPPEEAVSVSVLGAVRSPGIYKLPVGDGASLLRAIALAGGLNDRASKSGIQIKRAASLGEESIIKVDFGKILSGEKPDVLLEEGDVIVVKESFF